MSECSKCNGGGSITCPKCEGSGVGGPTEEDPLDVGGFIRSFFPGGDYCTKCRGEGTIECPACGGSGTR